MNASGMYVQQVPNYVRLVQLVDRQVGLRDRVFTIANWTGDVGIFHLISWQAKHNNFDVKWTMNEEGWGWL